jgi:hypothetical protein
MADKIALFLGIWFVASVPIGMAIGRIIEVRAAMPEATRRSASEARRAPRRAA